MLDFLYDKQFMYILLKNPLTALILKYGHKRISSWLFNLIIEKNFILSPRILHQLSIKINWEIRMITNSEWLKPEENIPFIKPMLCSAHILQACIKKLVECIERFNKGEIFAVAKTLQNVLIRFIYLKT